MTNTRKIAWIVTAVLLTTIAQVAQAKSVTDIVSEFTIQIQIALWGIIYLCFQVGLLLWVLPLPEFISEQWRAWGKNLMIRGCYAQVLLSVSSVLFEFLKTTFSQLKL